MECVNNIDLAIIVFRRIEGISFLPVISLNAPKDIRLRIGAVLATSQIHRISSVKLFGYRDYFCAFRRDGIFPPYTISRNSNNTNRLNTSCLFRKILN